MVRVYMIEANKIMTDRRKIYVDERRRTLTLPKFIPIPPSRWVRIVFDPSNPKKFEVFLED